jgi:uncharacterized repeat protein (TIGR03803 family)
MARAQTFQTLAEFNGRNGIAPESATLVQGVDGNLYGTAAFGGNKSCGYPSGCGTIFAVTSAGALNILYTFCSQSNCIDGAYPFSSLVLATDGNFYGTTFGGGSDSACIDGSFVGCGTVFKITRNGVLTTLHSFKSAEGSFPVGGVIQGTDGNLYGTTRTGGALCNSGGCGTVFRITAAGQFTTLHIFDGTDGDSPYASLIQATDGSLYGTTYSGGANNYGTVFKMTPTGVFTLLHSFDSIDGANPVAPLIQAMDGKFYGTTQLGGTSSQGTAFRISADGSFSLLYNFNTIDGDQPFDPLVQATDGNFYVTTVADGQSACGTVLEIVPGKPVTILHTFQGTDGDGCAPYEGLFQATNGILYGATSAGGSSLSLCPAGCGTIFSETTGLRPFVITVPTAAKVGGKAMILGTNLTGTTSVTFNGTAATFKVVSATEMTTTIPAGATTGTVQVGTPGGTLSSNVPFRVLP